MKLRERREFNTKDTKDHTAARRNQILSTGRLVALDFTIVSEGVHPPSVPPVKGGKGESEI